MGDEERYLDWLENSHESVVDPETGEPVGGLDDWWPTSEEIEQHAKFAREVIERSGGLQLGASEEGKPKPPSRFDIRIRIDREDAERLLGALYAISDHTCAEGWVKVKRQLLDLTQAALEMKLGSEVAKRVYDEMLEEHRGL